MAEPLPEDRLRAEAARLLAGLKAAGAVRVEPGALQPAETLLDLYGEDIRARAYVTHDPLRGEMMLRPDFTVPVVERHMREGAEPARYAYAGPVWRKQAAGAGMENEVLQVGFELFDRADPARADAEVFALIADLLKGRGLRAVTGDLGILKAAIEGLDTLESRKAALMRHIWRPARFRALLARFSGRAEVPESRRALLEAARGRAPEDLLRAAGTPVGLRGAEEIAARVRALMEDAESPSISGDEVRLVESILSLEASCPEALERLRALERGMPALGPANDRLAARLAALEARGVAVSDLAFEGSYGSTSMEYYDGFVFGFAPAAGSELPVVASGGRYDALTAVLGRGRAIPAVGGVIRPAYLLAAEGAA